MSLLRAGNANGSDRPWHSGRIRFRPPCAAVVSIFDVTRLMPRVDSRRLKFESMQMSAFMQISVINFGS